MIRAVGDPTVIRALRSCVKPIQARPFVRQRVGTMIRTPFVAAAAVRDSRPLVREADVVVDGPGGVAELLGLLS